MGPRACNFSLCWEVQTLPVWILADSGSVRNLIDEAVYDRLPFKPLIRDPGGVRVIGGNGEAFELRGFTVLPVSIENTILWHKFGVVPRLPLEVLVGADIMAAHQSTLQYLKDKKKKLHFGLKNCVTCCRFRSDPEVGTTTQLRFVDCSVRRRRNRTRIGTNFLATLPAVFCDEFKDNECDYAMQLAETSVATVDPGSPSDIGEVADDKPESCANETPEQTGKLQKALGDLKLAALNIQEPIRKRLIQVARKNLDAYAGSPTDLGRTSVVVHTIRTGEAVPFRHKLRPIPLARRQYLEQEVERLMSVGAVSPADPGACPYASRTVIAPKKDGSLRMCVDYRDVNAQTIKDSFPLPRIDQVWPLICRAKYFASLDLIMGYYQVEVDPKDRAKTAFLTHRGLYVYNVMPFGLCNAPATFQRLMECILGPLIGNGVLVYLDDGLIYAET